LEPTKVNCWDNYQFSNTSCTWVNIGTQPIKPNKENCWDNYQFNTDNCVWVNIGTQPVKPNAVNCWDNYQFNTDNCAWENVGIQPAAPTDLACYQTATWNSSTCVWDVTGSQPGMPMVECYQTVTWNSSTCQWDVTGTRASAPTITPGGATTFCQNGSVVLTSSSDENNQWYLDGNILFGSTGKTYTATTSGKYTLKVIVNGCESESSAFVEVTVNPLPQLDPIQGSMYVCIGAPTTFTSNISGGTWTIDNGDLASINNVTGLVTGLSSGTSRNTAYLRQISILPNSEGTDERLC
jgi:hypothetical protein